jgi:hypothetical protein
MKFETIEYTVPAHWLSAIVNGDESSFDYYDDEEDFAAYQSFCETEVRDAIVEVVGEESYFSHHNDGGILPCSVYDCLFHYPVKS